jgi:hypothetical protein
MTPTYYRAYITGGPSSGLDYLGKFLGTSPTWTVRGSPYAVDFAKRPRTKRELDLMHMAVRSRFAYTYRYIETNSQLLPFVARGAGLRLNVDHRAVVIREPLQLVDPKRAAADFPYSLAWTRRLLADIAGAVRLDHVPISYARFCVDGDYLLSIARDCGVTDTAEPLMSAIHPACGGAERALARHLSPEQLAELDALVAPFRERYAEWL